MEDSKPNLDARSSRCRKARSSLVRRLVQAWDDPAKRRIRHWLSDINDEQLLAFGLTQEDIALLRGTLEGPHACEAQSPWDNRRFGREPEQLFRSRERSAPIGAEAAVYLGKLAPQM
jgi:hypothetical protein